MQIEELPEYKKSVEREIEAFLRQIVIQFAEKTKIDMARIKMNIDFSTRYDNINHTRTPYVTTHINVLY